MPTVESINGHISLPSTAAFRRTHHTPFLAPQSLSKDTVQFGASKTARWGALENSVVSGSLAWVDSIPRLVSDLNLKARNEDGRTVFMALVNQSRPEHLLNEIIRRPENDIDAQDKKGQTALMLAQGTHEALFLLNHLADCSKKDKRNRTALMHYLVQPTFISSLLVYAKDHASDSMPIDQHPSNLDEALFVELLEKMDQQGLDINAQEAGNQKTALIHLIQAYPAIVAYTGQMNMNLETLKRMVEVLKEAGAKTNVQDGQSKTAFDYAAAEKLPQSVLDALQS